MVDPCARIYPLGAGGKRPGYPPPTTFQCTIVFIMRMYINMKLQDYFPFDATILGLKNLYYTVGTDSFYVQSECIVCKDKILTKGKRYVIVDSPTKEDLKMDEIILLDGFYYEGDFHLISQDIRTRRISDIHFCLECPEKHCRMLLVDINYFHDKMDAKAIKQYCNCTENIQKKSKTKSIHSNDLLEFEF
jgi:hypothetical protein